MKVTLIAAMDEDRLIGVAGGGLPWRGLERDKCHFRSYTAGKALLLGRRTFEEMLGWFDGGHRPIVVTRDPSYRPEGGHPVVASVDEGVGLARARGEGELVGCGGATLYRLALPAASELNLTVVHHRFGPAEGGAFFPDPGPEGFREVGRERFEADDENPWPMSFVLMRRAGGR